VKIKTKPHWTVHGTQQVVIMGANLLSGVLIARSLGPSGNGIATFIASITGMALPILEIGTRGSLMREAMGEKFQYAAKCAQSIAPWTWALAVAVSLGVFFTHPPTNTGTQQFEGSYTNAFYVACVITYFVGLLTEGRWMTTLLTARSLQKKLQRDTIICILGTSTRCTAAIILAGRPYTLIATIYATYAIEGVIRGIVNRVALKDDLKVIKETKVTHSTIIHHLKEGIFLLPVFLGTAIITNYGNLLIKTSSGIQTLGTLGVAQKLSLVYMILVGTLYERSFHKTAWRHAIYATLAIGCLTALMSPAIPLLYGTNYTDSQTWFLMLIVPCSLQTFTSIATMKATGNKKTGVVALAFLLGVALFTILAPYLISSATLSGVPGLCSTLTISYGAILATLLWYGRPPAMMKGEPNYLPTTKKAG
jgi:O-antigen/teichoic acid export membrane protein